MVDPLQEDQGLVRVHQVCIEMGAIWRPTPCHDVGIDGQLEFLDANDRSISTGKILAVQVKSGPSHFDKPDPVGFRYYPSKKHRRYWHAVELPVILVLHEPSSGTTLYADVKSQLEYNGPIVVDQKNVFEAASGSLPSQMLATNRR